MFSSCLQSDDLFLPKSCILKTKLFKAQSCSALTPMVVLPTCIGVSRFRSWFNEHFSSTYEGCGRVVLTSFVLGCTEETVCDITWLPTAGLNFRINFLHLKLAHFTKWCDAVLTNKLQHRDMCVCTLRYLEGDVKDASAAAVLTSGAIAVWDLLLGHCTALLPPDPTGSWALARWATSSTCLLAGQRDGTVCLYRYRQPQPGAA